MKLATLKSPGCPDGEPVILSRDLKCFARIKSVVGSVREALERWQHVHGHLAEIYRELNEEKFAGAESVKSEEQFASVLPRTWLFADGSAFIHHIRLVRKARKADPPATLLTVPLMYQAESGRFLAPTEDIPQRDFAHGTDFEAEVGVVLDHVPMGVTPEQALSHVKLILLINDVSLRGLIPEELAQGFGFFQSKPNKALSPVALTPDELGDSWKDGKLHLPLHVKFNGEFFGKANAGEMHFHFGELIAHAARTRDLPAGTIIGSGTVSNEDASMGSSCLAEKRMLEQINTGEIRTPFMKAGDTVEIQMLDHSGQSLFGRIFQKVTKVH